MQNVSRLLFDEPTPGDDLRYGVSSEKHGIRVAKVHQRPIVVCNITRTCNIHCAHCYVSPQDEQYPGQLTTQEAKTVLYEMAVYKAPVVLFSGVEPTLRHDLPDLISYANELGGLNPLIPTNGTLLAKEKVKQLSMQD